MQRFFGEKRDEYGRAEAGASVSVYDTGTSNLSVIYAASDPLTTPFSAIPNPLTTDANGRYGFAAPTGVYDIVIHGSGAAEYKNKVAMFDQTTSGTTGAGGSSTQIQYNTGGVLTGSASLTTDGTNLTVSGYESVEAVRFNTSTPDTSNVTGNTYWDSTNKTLTTVIDSTLGINLQHGQEQYVHCINDDAVKILNGKVVYINGSYLGEPTVVLAKANTLADSWRTIGIATQDIEVGAIGLITTFGVVHNLDTSGYYADGAPLFLSATTAGNLTDAAPSSPNYVVQVGLVVGKGVAGAIFVSPSRIVANDDSLTDNSKIVAPSQRAVKAYSDAFASSLASTASAALGDALVGVKNGTAATTQHEFNSRHLDAKDYGTDLGSAVGSIGATVATLTVSSAITLNADATVPSTLTLRFERPGTLTIASGKVLTYNGDTSGWGIYNMFLGAGTVTGPKKVYPEWFGEVVTDAGATINKAFACVGSSSSVELTASNYPITTTITFPPDKEKIKLFSTHRSTISVPAGSLNAIDCTATNEGSSAHIVEGLYILGTNVYYVGASGYTQNNTGAGIRMQRPAGDTTNTATAYNVVVRDCVIYKMKYGIRLRCVINCHFEDLDIRFNNYGVYFDGGMSNANDFSGCMITTNATAGVYSAGTTGGALTESTNNVFHNCIMESNHPYQAGTIGDPAVVGGFAIYLNNSFDWVFDNCYTEDHEWSVYLTGGSKGNQFKNNRSGPGGGGLDAIMLSGATTWNNIFSQCKSTVVALTNANFCSDNANQIGNQVLDCEGINFISGSVLTMPYIRNIRGNLNVGSDKGYGQIGSNPSSQRQASEGTTPGDITGLATATATLHVRGISEVLLGSGVAAAAGNTTITTIDGKTPGQFLAVYNYQATRTVTIKADSGMTGQIVPKGGVDVVFNNYGQFVLFYITGGDSTGVPGRAYEVGRNF